MGQRSNSSLFKLVFRPAGEACTTITWRLCIAGGNQRVPQMNGIGAQSQTEIAQRSFESLELPQRGVSIARLTVLLGQSEMRNLVCGVEFE